MNFLTKKEREIDVETNAESSHYFIIINGTFLIIHSKSPYSHCI